MVLALGVLAAVCTLAAIGTITGNDAFTVIVGVAIGGGVYAGANLGTAGTPAPQPPVVTPPVAQPTPIGVGPQASVG
jgi:hypothetical protein